jgi:hypothetical protein
VELIDDPKIRDLAGVFSYLAGRGQAIGTLYLISHAADDGTLSFRCSRGQGQEGGLPRVMRDALKISPDLFGCRRASSTSPPPFASGAAGWS